jgi:hypothetical protein
MAYFKQLTGSKLPKKEKFTINYNGKIHIGNMYRVVDKNGNKFTLRDLSSSKVKGGTTERWTIDINKGALGNNKKLEIKFK